MERLDPDGVRMGAVGTGTGVFWLLVLPPDRAALKEAAILDGVGLSNPWKPSFCGSLAIGLCSTGILFLLSNQWNNQQLNTWKKTLYLYNNDIFYNTKENQGLIINRSLLLLLELPTLCQCGVAEGLGRRWCRRRWCPRRLANNRNPRLWISWSYYQLGWVVG